MGSSTKKLLGSSTIVFVGTMIASVFSYLFNMIMGRMLGPSQYGEMTAILSLFMILSVGSGAVATVVMRYSGELCATGNYQAIRRLKEVSTRYLILIASALFLMGVILSPQIAHFLAIEHVSAVVIALASFFFGFMIVITKGILQGTQQFVPFSISGILEMFCRLLLGILFVKIGWSVNGAVGAVLSATAIAYIYTLLPVKKLLKRKSAKTVKPFLFDKREILSYSLPTLASSILLAAALNMDIIIIKHYFSAEEAGLYAAVSTIAKIITYATAPILSVMFPMISEHRAKGNKHYRIFLFSLLLTIIGTLIILGAYAVAPGKIVALLYGDEFTGLYYLLPEIGLVVLFYSLVALMVNYYQAVRDFFYVAPFALAIIGQLVLIEFYHPTISEVVKVMIASLSILFAVLFCYYLFTKREQLTALLRNDYQFDGE